METNALPLSQQFNGQIYQCILLNSVPFSSAYASPDKSDVDACCYKQCLYFVLFARYSMSNNGMPLKSGLTVIQGHWKRQKITYDCKDQYATVSMALPPTIFRYMYMSLQNTATLKSTLGITHPVNLCMISTSLKSTGLVLSFPPLHGESEKNYIA